MPSTTKGQRKKKQQARISELAKNEMLLKIAHKRQKYAHEIPFGTGIIKPNRLICTDSLTWMKKQPANCVDLIVASPPYEDARTYGIDCTLKGQDWVDWFFPYVIESLRLSRGMVAFVIQGKTRNFKWSATPALLLADLERAGVILREPQILESNGTPGSGGPDYFRKDLHYIVCATAEQGRLPWSDVTACGHPPKYGPGGAPTNRKQDGSRVREAPAKGQGKRLKRGDRGFRETKCDGVAEDQPYVPPKLANPGSILKVSGGHLGSDIAHENEAPFPEAVAEFYIKSFCPPGGIVLDPFMGSGTVPAVAIQTGRRYIGIDIRDSQLALATRRIKEARRRIKE